MLLVDLERHRVGGVDLLLAVETVQGASFGPDLGSHTGTMVGKVGSERSRWVGRALAVRRAVEGAEVEETAEKGPDVGKVGREESSRGLSDVPEGPVGAEGFVEAVEFAKDGGKDLRSVSG